VLQYTDLRRAALLAALAFLVYNANLRVIATGDSRAARYLPFAVLRSGSLTLDDFEAQVKAGIEEQYWVAETQGRLASQYPVVTPLLVTPLYIPAALYLHAVGWEERSLGFLAALMEKLSASLVAALSVGLLFLVLRRRAPPVDALLLTLAYGFGTSTWSTSSQALWQHGPAQLLIILALLAVTGEPTAGRFALAGTCCGLLVANRAPDLLLAAALALFVAVSHRREPRRLAAFFLPSVAVGVLLLTYNYALFGRLLGGYFLTGPAGSFFQHPVTAGLAGSLLSPGKGLLVFSPFLVFLLARPFLRGPRRDALLTACLTAGVIAQLLLYGRVDWRAGYCYGQRYLADLIPLLIWLLVPVLARLRTPGRTAFITCMAAAAWIQTVGAFYYPAGGSDPLLNRDFDSPWQIENAQFLLELRNGPAPR